MYNKFEAFDGSAGGLAQRTPLLMRDLIQRGPTLQPDEEIWTRIDKGYHRITWREHKRRSHKLASALQQFGIRMTNRVATFEFNTSRHMELYHAIPCMGSILHPLNIRLHPQELAYIIEDATDRVIFCGAKLLSVMEEVERKFPSQFSSVELVVVMGHNERSGGWTSSLRVPTVDYEQFIAKGDENFVFPDFDENTGLALCYTSGTTGKPKGVLYTHRSTYLHTIVNCMRDTVAFSATDSLLPLVPQFHVLSWGWPYVGMMLGCRYCQFNSFSGSKDVLKFLIDAEVTKAAGVPTIWQEIETELKSNPLKYSGKFKVKEIVCGGSAPSLGMMKWYYDTWNIQFLHAWGMTETNPIGTVSRPMGKRKHLNWTPEQRQETSRKQGIPIHGLKFKIVNPENWDEEMPHDGKASGELLVKGPWICGAYFKNRGADKFHHGWLATGDIASLDEEGYMVIRDRSKDLIKSGGEWISSVDMENMTTSLPEITKACVVGIPHPKWDERPIVIGVVPGGGDPAALLKKVRKHLSSKFAKFQLPDDFLIWDEIPETSTRKMDKKTVRKKLKEQGYQLPSLRSKM